ncbi:hypothetical protein DUNSADRAFT_17033 [Dunaliella salina]|nr:hypothetical protein DUNSADRAFT_17033 [Dunaliella salina]|eukprot:KAF5840337.1 hypothetical protein DUNSADRAFT_17033 [Dunaliella salina]
MAAFARAQAQLGESAALTPAAQRAADDASELARMEHDAAQHDAALVAAAAAISTDAELTDRLSPTMSCAIGNAREQKQHALSAAAVAAPQAQAARVAVCEQKMQKQVVAVGQPPPLSGAMQQDSQAAATAAAAAGALAATPAAAAAERPHPGEPSALALAASGMLTALPGDQPALGPAQTYLLSSLFSESGEVPPLGVDSAKLMAQLLEQQQVGEGGLAAAGGAGLTAPREAGLTAAEGAGAPSAPPAAANERNPLYTAMQREVSEFQKKQEQRHADPWARHVPVVLKKIISRRSGEKQAGERQVGDKRRQDALVSHPVSPFLSPPASPTTPSPPESPFKTAATPSTQPSTQGVPSTQPSTQEVPPIPAPLPHAPSLAAYSEPNSPKPTAAPPKPLSPTPPLQLQPDTDLACPSPTRVCAAGIPRPGAPEPPPTPPFPLHAPTASLPALSPSMEGLLEDRSDGLQGLEAAPISASALHEAVHGTASLPPLPTALERSPSLTAAAFAALVPQREQFTQKVASVASATQLAADELARQQSLPREAADAGPVAQASAPVMAVLEHARTAIKDATASTDDYKAAAEASMMGLGLPGVLSTSQLEGSQSPLDLASSIQSKIAADVQQQKQQQQQQLETLPEQAELEMRAQQQELQPQEQDKVEGGMRAPCCGSLASQASQAATAEPESARSLEKAVDEGRKEAIKDVAEMAQDGPAAEQHPNQSVAATAPRGAARQGGESTPATHRQYPEPPLFKEGAKPSVAEIRAACRAYAEAAAAAQGFDLGMPSPDSRVVRQVAEGPPPIPEPARPSQRWLLGLAPDAATYGIIYFLGDYSNGRFDLEGSTGPYKLDLGNVLYAPVAFYDQKVGRLLVWGYLKELWQLSPPPAMCNKFAMSGGVSMPRALYLKGGKLFQVPIPEVSELRQEGRCFSAYGMRLLPGAPLLVPGMQAANGMQAGIEGDHVDIELVIRRGSASRTTLLLDSWRPKGRGAAALVFDWDTKQLKIIYKAHMRPDLWSSAAEADPEASHAADKEGTRWAQDLAGLLATSTTPSAEGGKSIIADEDGAVYDVFTDAKCPPVPDMNPAVPDWIRMDRGRAGGTLDMREGDPLELRVFIDGSAVEIFTGTGQVLSTRVYRGAPSRTAHSESLKELGVSQGECPGEHGGTSAGAHNVAEGSQAAPPGEDSSMAASHGQDGSRAAHQASSIQSDQGGAKLQLLSVGGSCVIERAEFHQMRSIWLRGQADAPLPPPVSQEALELWRADARKAANYAEEAALAVGNKMKQ